MTIRIKKVFESIQGEGSIQGLWSLFVRVAGCNRSCVWCDTQEAIKTSNTDHLVEPEDLISFLKLDKRLPPQIVFTGGEPFLYINDIFKGLSLAEKGFWRDTIIAFETNGDLLSTLDPQNPDYVKVGMDTARIHFSVSPKILRAREPFVQQPISTESTVQDISDKLRAVHDFTSHPDIKLMVYKEDLKQVLTEVIPGVLAKHDHDLDVSMWVYPILPQHGSANFRAQYVHEFVEKYSLIMEGIKDHEDLFGCYIVRLGIQMHKFYGLK